MTAYFSTLSDKSPNIIKNLKENIPLIQRLSMFIEEEMNTDIKIKDGMDGETQLFKIIPNVQIIDFLINLETYNVVNVQFNHPDYGKFEKSYFDFNLL